MVVEHDGKAQVIISGRDRLHSYDLATGEVIWECGRVAAAAIPVPVATEELVFSMTGYPMTSRTLFAIPIDSKGDITEQDKLVWSRDRANALCPFARAAWRRTVLYQWKLRSLVFRESIDRRSDH